MVPHPSLVAPRPAERPTAVRPGRPSPASALDVVRTAFLGHPVVLTAAGALLPAATAQLARLTALWDVRSRDSDLHRLLVRPACAVEVSAETVLLARSALDDEALRAGLGLPTAGGGLVHVRRNLVGLLPGSAARAGQLLLACAVDLVCAQLRREGADSAVVRIGSTSRALGDDVPEVPLDLPGLARDVALHDGALAVAVQPSSVHGRGPASDRAAAVAAYAPAAVGAQSLADALLLLPPGRAVELLTRSSAGGLVLLPGGGWTSTSGTSGPSGAREQLRHR